MEGNNFRSALHTALLYQLTNTRYIIINVLVVLEQYLVLVEKE